MFRMSVIAILLLTACQSPQDTYEGKLTLQGRRTLKIKDKDSQELVAFKANSELLVTLKQSGFYFHDYKLELRSKAQEAQATIDLSADMFQQVPCYKNKLCYRITANAADIGQSFDVKIQIVSEVVAAVETEEMISCSYKGFCMNFDVTKGKMGLSEKCPGKQKALFIEKTFRNYSSTRFYEPGLKTHFGEFLSELEEHSEKKLVLELSRCKP